MHKYEFEINNSNLQEYKEKNLKKRNLFLTKSFIDNLRRKNNLLNRKQRDRERERI